MRQQPFSPPYGGRLDLTPRDAEHCKCLFSRPYYVERCQAQVPKVRIWPLTFDRVQPAIRSSPAPPERIIFRNAGSGLNYGTGPLGLWDERSRSRRDQSPDLTFVASYCLLRPFLPSLTFSCCSVLSQCYPFAAVHTRGRSSKHCARLWACRPMCHISTAKRRISATRAIFLCLGFLATMRS